MADETAQSAPGAMQIVVSSINHDAKSLLSPIQDAFDGAYQVYGTESVRRPELADSGILPLLREFEQAIRYISNQMTAVGEGFILNQKSQATLDAIRSLIQQSSSTMRSKADTLLALAHRNALTGGDESFRILATHCDELVNYITKMIDIAEKILSSREEVVSLETEYVRALNDIRRKYFDVEWTRGGRFKSSVRANRGAVYLLFRELLSNSFKYRDPARPLHLDTQEFREEGGVTITVADNGIGIDPAHCDQDIFKVGFRGIVSAHPAGPHAPPGQGVGLSIVALIVKYLRGTIKAASALGEGTRFYMAFPTS